MSLLVSFPWSVTTSVLTLTRDVSYFWVSKSWDWMTKKSARDQLLEDLAESTSFEDSEDTSFHLDSLLGLDIWRQTPASKLYDYRLIHQRLEAFIEAREDEDIQSLINLLRSGLVRNLGNISSPRLFNRAYAGTKHMIEEYITQVALAIQYVTALPTVPTDQPGFTSQAKLDLLHDTRQAFGRSTLVLQGGSIFGLCHLGVVKALHLRGLLPRIITGSGTGALIAALVGVHTEDELLAFLTGQAIDLTAFADPANQRFRGRRARQTKSAFGINEWANTLARRVTRFMKYGYFLDVQTLEDCVRANVGDLTFEEAYVRTKRVLNITVPASGTGGSPSVLNYLTAPNVLIWSAALASNATPSPLYSYVILQCRDDEGEIVPWTLGQSRSRSSQGPFVSGVKEESPLTRISELFNVNHFIISQARPYLAPFLRSDFYRPSPRDNVRWPITIPLLRLLTLEVRHRLSQLDSLGLVPLSVRRFLVDEALPGVPGSANSVTLVPELTLADFMTLLETPTTARIERWILRGERSVWPAVGAIRCRTVIEVELDRGYQVVRRKRVLKRSRGASEERNGELFKQLQPTQDADDEGRKRSKSAGAV